MIRLLFIALLLIGSLCMEAWAMDEEAPKESPRIPFAVVVRPLNQVSSELTFNWKTTQLKLLVPAKTSEAFNISIQLDNMLQAIENDYMERLKKEILPDIQRQNTFIEVSQGEEDPSKESPYYQDHLNKIKKDILFASGEIHLEILEFELEFMQYLADFHFIEEKIYINTFNEINERTQDVLKGIDAQLKEINPNEKKLFNFLFSPSESEDSGDELNSEQFEALTIGETIEARENLYSRIKKNSSQVGNYLKSWKQKVITVAEDSPKTTKALELVNSVTTATLAKIGSFWRKKETNPKEAL